MKKTVSNDSTYLATGGLMIEWRDLISFPIKPNGKRVKMKLFKKFSFNLQMKIKIILSKYCNSNESKIQAK